MLKSESDISDKELVKQKIRERYKGSDAELLEVIPVKKTADFYDNVKRRVAVYVRVSTDNLQQTSSYELQKNYYEDKVKSNPNWTLVKIYADEGISGTSLKHRDAFNEMIEDCKAGKIDLIITKSIQRFARNTVDCISTVRLLIALKNPVGVFFEMENMFTLNENTEMGLSFLATMAQEESHIKSTVMTSSLQMRHKNGILYTPILLGYDRDEDGKLTINENEARTVRLIFFMYLYGYSCQEIADALTKLHRRTKKGNTVWSAGSVLHILRNERHCGEVLTWKRFKPDYREHKTRKNRGERPQYRYKGEHEPIISKDDFIAVQHLLNNAKYGGKGILPELKVISEGALKGFISINPHWAGFKAEDYLSVSSAVCDEGSDADEEIQIEAQSGDFDFRGFEVAREQFFGNTDKLLLTFNTKSLGFSQTCIKKMPDAQYIELFIHPVKKLLAVRTADEKNKNAVKWYKLNSKGEHITRYISGTAFLKTIYTLLDWDAEHKYRVRGIRRNSANESLLIFDLNETELYISDKKKEENLIDVNAGSLARAGSSVIAYPSAWADNFGSNYYRRAQENELREISAEEELCVKEELTTFSEYNDLHVTSREKAQNNINELINEMKTEDTENG